MKPGQFPIVRRKPHRPSWSELAACLRLAERWLYKNSSGAAYASEDELIDLVARRATSHRERVKPPPGAFLSDLPEHLAPAARQELTRTKKRIAKALRGT